MELLVDGEPAAEERYELEEAEGVGIRLFLPKTARELQLRAPGAEPWILALVAVGAEVSKEAREVELLTIEANSAFSEDGDWERGLRLVSQAMDRARAVGMSSRALDAALLGAFYLGWTFERAELARALLDDALDLAEVSPQGRADWRAALGHVRWGQGDVAGAALEYRAASRFAIEVEDMQLIAEAIPMYAVALSELGYFRAARVWSHYSLSRVEPGSEIEGQVLESAGWANLVLRRHGLPHSDPVELYRRAVEIFEPGGSFPAPHRLGEALLGLAEASHMDGRRNDALRWLGRIDDEHLNPDDRAYHQDLELRINLELGAGDVELGLLLQRLKRAVAEAPTPEALWRLASRRGDLLSRAGRWDDAIESYRGAEGHLDEMARLAAFGVGRFAIVESHSSSAVGLAEALLHAGRPEDALCTLREAEGRRSQVPLPSHLRGDDRSFARAYLRKKAEIDALIEKSDDLSVAERREFLERIAREHDELRGTLDYSLRSAGRRWGRHRCEDLSSRLPGELVLGMYPSRDEWLILARDDRGVISYHVPAPAKSPAGREERERLAASLLGPIGERLSTARRLRILTTDGTRGLDVQTLPWHGRPLLETVPIVYGMEVAHDPSGPSSDTPTALLIPDPTRSLPGAETEVVRAAIALTIAGYAVTIMEQDDASSLEVQHGLERASLVHFSGHSWHPTIEDHGRWPPYAGGGPSAASHLVLAGGQDLASYDIPLLRSVPEVVVLEGCEAGALDYGFGGTSLAYAFSSAGASIVIAFPDELRDDVATAFGAQLYVSLDDGRNRDFAGALRKAQLALWDRFPDPEAGIGRYRAWVP